ncbi:GTPase-activating protein [Xylographa pallens]|nr:GTPase-activating protein [Xylographa pallens]
MLKFDSLALSSSSLRPRTPPSSSHSIARNTNTPPPRRPSSALSNTPSRPGYATSLRKDSDWLSNDEEYEGEEQDHADYDLNEDEDEFGLPSIANARRAARRAGGPSPDILGDRRHHVISDSYLSSGTLVPSRPRANSADIAEERGAPSYPIPRKSEGKILRPQYKDILRGSYVVDMALILLTSLTLDPANSLHLISHSPIPPNASAKEIEAHSTRISRINKFKRILQSSTISLNELRNLAWKGVPEEVRSMSWQILLGYLPTSSERRVATLERKRKEYLEGIRQAFGHPSSGVESPITGKVKNSFSQGRSRGLDENVWHQISIDVPRTSPHIELYGYEATQRSLERILYLWAIRHPASGYVQGINDLVTPFWQVFLGCYITDSDIESGMDPGQLPRPVLDAVEADSFWCLTKLLDGIQDNYIFAQPGIVRQVGALRDLTTRIDVGLAKHLEREGIEFMQFSFRWMNCLLMREVNVKCTIRMWDAYMAEEQGFSEFHIYVCAAFLVKWTDQLVKMDFQEIMMFLQALPTRSWTEKDIELLLSEAFIWQTLYRGSSAHLKNHNISSAIT